MLEVRLAASSAAAEPTEIPIDAAGARAEGARFARTLAPGRTAVQADGLSGTRLAAYVEGLVLGAYRYTQQTEPRPAPEVVELAGARDEAGLARGLRAAGSTVWARDLTNTPANVKTPAWLADQAARALVEVGVDVAVRDEVWLRDHGFGGVVAVGGGSAAPPRLIEASYRPHGALPGVHLVLVGKGITFDTGGLNRKPGESMRLMHTDMAGGAAALAALRAVAEDGTPIRVTAVVPVAENSFGGGSYRPTDVVRHYGGRTSEIHNTDAEGRLVLADALAYAVARLRPTALVDIATLTGAMKVALGLRMGGLFATSDEVAGQLLAAASVTGEPLWRMPLPAEYEQTLTRTLRMPPTLRRARRASPRPCSCGPSRAMCRGRTWTSPVRLGRRRTTASGRAVPPGSAPGCCTRGSARRSERFPRLRPTTRTARSCGGRSSPS